VECLPSSPYNLINLLLRQRNILVSLDFTKPFLLIQSAVSSEHNPLVTIAYEDQQPRLLWDDVQEEVSSSKTGA